MPDPKSKEPPVTVVAALRKLGRMVKELEGRVDALEAASSGDGGRGGDDDGDDDDII